MKKVLNVCIDSDQNAYLKGRFIGNNIRLIDDVICYFEEKRIPELLFFLDLEKAFAQISWDFLHKSLEKFNFGSILIGYIKTLHTKYVQSCIVNNNWQSSFFSLQRGLRQGCPVSALFLLVVIEILAIDIRSDEDIQGVQLPGSGGMPGTQVKISLLADEKTIFVATEISLKNAMRKIKTVGCVAGPTLKYINIKRFYFGEFNVEQYKEITWSNQFVKTLGVYFSKNMKLAYEKHGRKR